LESKNNRFNIPHNVIDTDNDLANMDLNVNFVDNKHINKDEKTNRTIDSGKKDEIQIKGIKDVEINMAALFSEGDYRLGKMSQYSDKIEGFCETDTQSSGLITGRSTSR